MSFRKLVSLAALILTIAASGGCGFTVPPNTNIINNNGTWFVPDNFPTIQAAIDFAIPGEVVVVRPGVYSPSTNGEFFPIFLKNGVDVIGQDPINTIVDAENTNYVFDAFRFDSVLQGFSIFHGIGTRGGGIFADDSRGVLANLYVIANRADDRGSGIFVSRSQLLLIQNVVVADNARSNLNGNPAQVEIEDSDIDFFNNTVAQGDSDGIRINAGSLGIYENNIFFANGSDGFGVGFADEAADPNGPITEFNEFFANVENDFFIAGQLMSAADANNLTPNINNNFNADPLFTDPLNDNFTLQPGSPAFNAGNPDPSFNNPDGSRNTLGAYGGPGAVLP
jgi:parallel beta helix pectate lyase-like protein